MIVMRNVKHNNVLLPYLFEYAPNLELAPTSNKGPS